jgi:hypothetical protein
MVLVQPTEHGREVMLAARERRAQIIMTAMQGLDPGARRALVRAAPHLKDLPKQVTEARSH